MFDNDVSGGWTAGDDLMVEGSTFCPTAIRNAVYDAGLDSIVLDLNGSLFNGQLVSCDVEIGGGGLSFFDTNVNGAWDNGEDIVLDVNGNNVFD